MRLSLPFLRQGGHSKKSLMQTPDSLFSMISFLPSCLCQRAENFMFPTWHGSMYQTLDHLDLRARMRKSVSNFFLPTSQRPVSTLACLVLQNLYKHCKQSKPSKMPTFVNQDLYKSTLEMLRPGDLFIPCFGYRVLATISSGFPIPQPGTQGSFHISPFLKVASAHLMICTATPHTQWYRTLLATADRYTLLALLTKNLGLSWLQA